MEETVSNMMIDPSISFLVETILGQLGLALLFPVIIVSVTFIFIILVIYFKIKEKREQNKFRMELYLKALEAGQDLPDNLLFEAPQKKSDPLKTAVILLSLGIGIICNLFEYDAVAAIFISDDILFVYSCINKYWICRVQNGYPVIHVLRIKILSE